MPNAIAAVSFLDAKRPNAAGQNQYFSTTSFSQPVLGTIGSSNRRFFYGPGLSNTDFGVSKYTQIKESMSLLIRGEFFNIFNHTQFTNPVGNFSSGQFGSVTSNRPARIGQVSAKFVW
jgi:hypothetical protein